MAIQILAPTSSRGGSRISGKEVHIFNGVGVHFADFNSFFLGGGGGGDFKRTP